MSGRMDKERIYAALNEAYFSAEPHERDVIEHLPALLRRGRVKTFVDVGASLGQYTLLASRCIEGGTIYAIEADPVRFEELERNCVRWAGESGNEIVPLHAAAADREGPVTFYVTDSSLSGGLFRHDAGGKQAEWREIVAEAATLDRLLAKERPDFIKVDVEGSELRVLRGATGILRAGRADFLIELHHWADPQGQGGPEDVKRFMASFGYRAVPFRGRVLFVHWGPLRAFMCSGLLRVSRLADVCGKLLCARPGLRRMLRPLRTVAGLGRRGAQQRLARLSKSYESLREALFRRRCPLCRWWARTRRAYGRDFAQCRRCGFVFAYGSKNKPVESAMGMEGSWSGPGGGGFREYYLAKMLQRDLGAESILLFGTGNTPALARLLADGLDVVGCDVSGDVVQYKRQLHGQDRFFMADELPAERKYDAIVAVEVIEHFADPLGSFRELLAKRTKKGVICGTTDFYYEGPIEDSVEPGYMRPVTHVAYWTERSMQRFARKHGLGCCFFELVRPGSVLPDEKYGRLWPNKRVFFLYDRRLHGQYFQAVRRSSPILPIDKA